MKRIFSILIISILLLSLPTFADSYYSTFGLGVPIYHVSPQAAGMGGAGIGVRQYLALNEMNPAAINLKYPASPGSGADNVYMTMASLNATYEAITNSYKDDETHTRSGNASGLQFAVPLYRNRFSFQASLKPHVSSGYLFGAQYDGVLEDSGFYRSVKGSGGITAASIGLQYAPFSWLSVGGLFVHYFGTFQETWKIDFDEDFYRDTRDEIYTHIYGNSYHLGLAVHPAPGLTLGAMYKPEFALNGNSDIEAGILTGISNPSSYDISFGTQDITYPMTLGTGISYAIPRFLFAADYYMQQWSAYAVDGIQRHPMNDYYRISGGVEYVSSRDAVSKYYERIFLRAGAYFAQLPFQDIAGEPVTEMFATFGMGFPFHFNRGRIDFSIEVGQRHGSSADPYKENIIRITGSATGAERWFQRLF